MAKNTEEQKAEEQKALAEAKAKAEAEAKAKAEAEANKKMTVKMRNDYFGTYGVFKMNKTVTLPAKVAKRFIKDEIAIEVKD